MSALELDKNRLFKHSLKVDLSQKFKTLKGARGSSPMRQNTSLFLFFGIQNGSAGMITHHLCQKVLSRHTIPLSVKDPTTLMSGPKLRSHQMRVVFFLYISISLPVLEMNHLDQ